MGNIINLQGVQEKFPSDYYPLEYNFSLFAKQINGSKYLALYFYVETLTNYQQKKRYKFVSNKFKQT